MLVAAVPAAGIVLGWVLAWLPRARWVAMVALVAATTYVADVNLDFHGDYRGMSRSFDVSSMDVLVVGLVVFLWLDALRRHQRPVGAPRGPLLVWWPAGWGGLVAFVAWCALTIPMSRVPLYGLMDLLKLVRGLAIYWVAANLVSRDGVAGRIPWLLLPYLVVECAVVALQYLQGYWWIPGTFTHKNSFAMATNMLLPPVLIAGLTRRHWSWPLLVLLWGAGAIAVVLSRSRMGWLTLAVASGATIVVALALAIAWRDGRLLLRQSITLVVVVLLGAAALAQMADGLMARLVEDREVSLDFRHRNNTIALALASRHLFGVGLNNYVVELWRPIGALLPPYDRTVAHHLYLYVAAETGWIGLIVFLVALAGVWATGLTAIVFGRRRAARSVVAGLLLGLLTAHLHSFLESDLLRRETYFIFCMLAGTVAGVHHAEGLGGLRRTAHRVVRLLRGPPERPAHPVARAAPQRAGGPRRAGLC